MALEMVSVVDPAIDRTPLGLVIHKILLANSFNCVKLGTNTMKKIVAPCHLICVFRVVELHIHCTILIDSKFVSLRPRHNIVHQWNGL